MDDGTRISTHYHMSSCNYHIPRHVRPVHASTPCHVTCMHNAQHDSEVDNVGVSRRMRIMNLVMI